MTAELVAAIKRAAVAGLTYAAATQVTTPHTLPGNPRRGRVVYERYCTQCHGARGDGNGEAAAFTTPRPRDFRQGLFKFRSTPPNALPLVSDLDRAIRDGLYATSMPPFSVLSPSTRLDVIAYIQTFSRRWQTDTPATPIVPPAGTNTNARVRRARADAVREVCVVPWEWVRQWHECQLAGRLVGVSHSARRSDAGANQVGGRWKRYLSANHDGAQWHPDARVRGDVDQRSSVGHRALRREPWALEAINRPAWRGLDDTGGHAWR